MDIYYTRILFLVVCIRVQNFNEIRFYWWIPKNLYTGEIFMISLEF